MPATRHIATINAYEIAAAWGGGYRGVYMVVGGERIASDVLDSLAAATFWAKSKAHELHSDDGYLLAAIRRRGEYLANVWVRV